MEINYDNFLIFMKIILVEFNLTFILIDFCLIKIIYLISTVHTDLKADANKQVTGLTDLTTPLY
jgi:hypothetical protein